MSTTSPPTLQVPSSSSPPQPPSLLVLTEAVPTLLALSALGYEADCQACTGTVCMGVWGYVADCQARTGTVCMGVWVGGGPMQGGVRWG